ncbi:MAG TPA: Xaa-Pro peptidase family protein [Actinomycetota bacterium]|jgi:Xaa-Pro aminopeptidase|nr:Xaa-Pro peptidase family protein [Actinomycetota bacterium]
MPNDGHADTEARRSALRALLASADLSALLVTKPVNVRYLTGFTGTYGALLLLHDRTLFFTDGRYRHQAAAEVPGAEVVLAPGDLLGAVGGTVRAGGTDGLGFEPAGLTWGEGQRLRAGLPGQAVMPAPPLVEELREVKDERELTAMREAARLGGEALAGLLPTLREGVTERQVAVDLELAMRRLGADGLAFDSIVAFGEQAAEPHHHPGDRPLGTGDWVKLDFGARVDGYCADMTRTVVFGHASQRQHDLYELVRGAQAAGLACLEAGVAAGEVDRACRQPIAEAGLGDSFPHPTGHGIGLEIHEAPRLVTGSRARIAAGTPVTVEPGVYLPGFGGVRIEDLAVARPGGHELLTTAPKELLEL